MPVQPLHPIVSPFGNRPPIPTTGPLPIPIHPLPLRTEYLGNDGTVLQANTDAQGNVIGLSGQRKAGGHYHFNHDTNAVAQRLDAQAGHRQHDSEAGAK